MLKKPAHEIQSRKFHIPGSPAACFMIGKSDHTIIHINNSVIRGSHFEDIMRKIPDALLGCTNRLDVDISALMPDAGVNEINQSGFGNFILELCPTNSG